MGEVIQPNWKKLINVLYALFTMIIKVHIPAWFDKLFTLVKTRISCKPDEAIEPSSISFVRNEDEDTGDIETISESERKDKQKSQR